MKDTTRKPLICLLAWCMVLGMSFAVINATVPAVAESYQWTDTGGGMDAFDVLSLVRGDSCLYALTNGNGIYRYDTAAASPAWAYIGMNGYGVFCLSWDGSHLYAGIGAGGVFRCDDPEAAAPAWTYIGPPGPDVTALGWDGSSLYAGTNGFSIYRCDDPTSVAPSWTNIGLNGLDIQALTWSGSYLFAGTSAGAYRYDPDAPSPAWTYIGMNSSYLLNLVWDGSYLYAAAGADGVYRCEDPAAASPAWTFIGPTEPPLYPAIYCLVWDGSHLYAAAGADGVYRCEDPAAASPAWIHVGMGGYDVASLAAFDGSDLYAGTNSQGIWHTVPTCTWYLAEGATAGDLNTFLLVQNPNDYEVPVSLTFMTESGPVSPPALQDMVIPADSRATFNPGAFIQTYNLSTVIEASGGDIVCERAVYDSGFSWGTDSIGSRTPASAWYLAEGATEGGMETWLLIQNPGESEVKVDITFMTGAGKVAGPQDYIIEAQSRTTLYLNDFVTDYDVSTVVTADGGIVVERAMYSADHTWATDSIGATAPATKWFLAEGCTGEGFETWVLVQNPGDVAVTADLDFMTSTGEVPGPHDVTIPAGTRVTLRLNDLITDYDVSTVVTADGGIVVERAMYSADHTWATDSIGYTR